MAKSRVISEFAIFQNIATKTKEENGEASNERHGISSGFHIFNMYQGPHCVYGGAGRYTRQVRWVCGGGGGGVLFDMVVLLLLICCC